MNIDQLKNRDYTIIIDKSGSMARDAGNGQTRWNSTKEATFALAAKCQEYDPDGLTVYAFSDSFKRHNNVTADKVDQVFAEHEPNGSTNLTAVLKDSLDDYFAAKSSGKAKANGALIVVVTDGEPDDRASVARVIVDATKKMDRDEELAIQFLQVGNDKGASDFLTYLDDELVSKQGAIFDIVDTTKQSDASSMSFADLLIKTITD